MAACGGANSTQSYHCIIQTHARGQTLGICSRDVQKVLIIFIEMTLGVHNFVGHPEE